MTGLGDPLKPGKLGELIFTALIAAVVVGGVGALVRWMLAPAQLAASALGQ